MMFKSFSQAGQDLFVREVLGDTPGVFLDIGANHPVEKSNTFGLEQCGWSGVCVERDGHCAQLLRDQRRAGVVEGDAAAVAWEKVEVGPADYLSLDVDEATIEVARRFPWENIRFKVLTVEHDEYRFGEERRKEICSILRQAGYQILCPQVCDQGMPFEVWAVDPRVLKPIQAWRSTWFDRRGAVEWREFWS